MGDFEPDIFKNPEDAGFKQHKLFDIGDVISIKDRGHFRLQLYALILFWSLFRSP